MSDSPVPGALAPHPPTSSVKNLRGIGLALAGFSLFAFADSVIKHLSGFYNIYTIQCFELFFSCVILLLLAPRLGGLKPVFRSPNLKWHALRGFVFFLQALSIIYGLSHMSLAKTYAIIFSMPFFAALLATIFLREKAGLKKWLAMGLGFAGVLVVLRPGIIPLEGAALAVLFSAVAFACANLMARALGTGDEPILTYALLPALIGFVCALPLYSMNFTIPALPHLAWLALCGGLAAGAVLCLSKAFVLAPAAVVAPFHYSQMIWGVTLGYFLFGDTLDLWTGAGAAIIIASGLWLIHQSRADSRPS